MREQVAAAFAELTGRSPTILVRSPGRVNLMGDHTDYNDGFVLPAAIEHATWFAAAPRPDRTVRLRSLERGTVELDISELAPTGTWSDYAAGTLWALGLQESGFDAVMGTTIPVGAGLSSSAAFELGIARIAYELGALSWDPVAAAVAGQRAENEFVGMPCGIMDQLIVACGKAGTASLIDCRTLDITPAGLPDEATVVILDTRTRRRLVDSAYEERRAACERVAATLGIAALRDASIATIDDAALGATDRRRATHVVTENERTQAMARLLEAGDIAAAGRLMNDSHASLRDDYEVSGPALDTISDIARRQPGCWGARMTGAGFAGCAVALVDAAAIERFRSAVSEQYAETTGNTARLYVTQPADGVSIS
jgi:galactokinase